jgi:hypothetical protein
MLAAFLAAAAFAVAHPCAAPLPHGPAVPAPIVLRTSCGGFRLDADGMVSRLPGHWLADHGNGTGRLFGAHIAIRRNRSGLYVLLARGRVVWRSHGLYRNDGGSVAFGPHAFAFASYRRGVFLTDLKRREHLVVRGRGLYPYTFTSAGDLIVTGGRTIAFVSPRGATLRRFHYRLRNGFSFDERTDTLYFVTPRGVLARARGTQVELARSLRNVDGTISVASPNLLVFSGAHAITVTKRDGTFVSSARWSARRLSSDSGVSPSPDGSAVAFRLSDAYPGSKSGSATVYVLRAGETRAEAMYTHRLGPSGCAVGANLMWHSRSLLYSSTDGRLDVLDTRSGTVRDLSRLALPRRSPAERVYAAWLSDFRH